MASASIEKDCRLAPALSLRGVRGIGERKREATQSSPPGMDLHLEEVTLWVTVALTPETQPSWQWFSLLMTRLSSPQEPLCQDRNVDQPCGGEGQGAQFLFSQTSTATSSTSRLNQPTEHLWVLVSWWALEPIPCRYWGMTLYDFEYDPNPWEWCFLLVTLLCHREDYADNTFSI